MALEILCGIINAQPSSLVHDDGYLDIVDKSPTIFDSGSCAAADRRSIHCGVKYTLVKLFSAMLIIFACVSLVCKMSVAPPESRSIAAA